MAQSRVNKVASIFTRVNGLLKAEIIPWKERPIWYDIYKQFPPDRDPVYRSIVDTPLDEQPPLPPKILYLEDKIRAMYHIKLRPLDTQVLNSNNLRPIWEIFIEVYYELESKGISKENLITTTCEEMKNRGLEVVPIGQKLSNVSELEHSDSESEKPDKAEDQFKSMLKNLLQNYESNVKTEKIKSGAETQ